MEVFTARRSISRFRSLVGIVGNQCLVVLVLLAGTLVYPVQIFAVHPPPPGTEEPTQLETNLFYTIFSRLEDMNAHWPTSISEVNSSLTATVTKAFKCPPGSAFDTVTVYITTTHVKWNEALANPNSSGTYYWNAEWPAPEHGHKEITCQNWIMFDSTKVGTGENNPPMGPISNEGLMYHELLHGQLLINATDTAAWQQKACNCDFDIGPADSLHVTIPGEVDGYYTGSAPDVDITVVEPPAQTADGDGNFDIELGTATKTPPFDFHTLAEKNVENIGVIIRDGKYHVTGNLKIKTEKGKFFIHIDPPDEWVFGGLENAMVVNPYPISGIPVLNSRAVTLLILLLLAGGVTVIVGKLRRRGTVG